MDLAVKAAWLLLALVHVPPAAVLVAPGLVRSLYGVESGGDAGVLLVHRGALFLAVVAACLMAVLDPMARRAAGVVVAISVVGFLAVYAAAGWPGGALRVIALADALALLPLGLVLVAAWRTPGA